MNKILPIILVVVLSGCAGGMSGMQKINPGMSINTVLEIMGDRDSFKTRLKGNDEYTLFKYTNRVCSPYTNFIEKCDFSIIFKNGKAIETDTFFLESSRERRVTSISSIFNVPAPTPPAPPPQTIIVPR